MRVFVTGGHGFLGRHVVNALWNSRQCQVVAPSHAELDLLHEGRTCDAIEESGADLVVHLAAKTGSIASIAEAPGDFFRDNVQMGMNVLNAAVKSRRARSIVCVGSVASYPASAPLPLREQDLWAGELESTVRPYGEAKRALLAMLMAYERQHGLRWIYLIPTNLYGPGDRVAPDANLVGGLIYRVAHADFAVRNPDTTRDLLHVRDCVGAVTASVRRLATGDVPSQRVINVASGGEVPIWEVAQAIYLELGHLNHGELLGPAAAGRPPKGVARRWMDISLASTELDWRPRIGLNEGLRETISWWMNEVRGG